jgi:hypothetical protein
MSKQKLTYTLISEGFAEYEFIPAYVNWIVKRQFVDCQVVQTNIRIAISKNSSVSKVLQSAATFCEQSFADTRNPCDLFIIGIDLDEPDFTDELDLHTKRLQELKEKMGKVYRLYEGQIVTYVPIQAIDYWIRYAQQDATPNSLESAGINETKQKIYGEKNPDRQKISKVVKAVAEKADFDRLARQSRSFARFHQQMVNFLSQQP